MKDELINVTPTENDGRSIVEVYRSMVEQQSVQNVEPVQAYGEFSNLSPHSQFSNHSVSFNQKA